MNCKYHNNIKATNTCNICGCWVCENCILEIDGRIYCKDCLRSKLKNNLNLNDNLNHFKSNSKNKSKFLTFLLCLCFPGSAQVYLGYTKRGLIIISFFLLGIYFDIFSNIIYLCFLFSLFDAFILNNNLQKGIYQEDNFSDVKKFLCENKFFIIVLCIIIVVPMIFNIFKSLLYNFFDCIKNILYYL